MRTSIEESKQRPWSIEAKQLTLGCVSGFCCVQKKRENERKRRERRERKTAISDSMYVLCVCMLCMWMVKLNGRHSVVRWSR